MLFFWGLVFTILNIGRMAMNLCSVRHYLETICHPELAHRDTVRNVGSLKRLIMRLYSELSESSRNGVDKMQCEPLKLTGRQTNRRYNSIDIAKGMCILFVIITHYAWQDSERLRFLFPFWIDMAVPIFMVISGFVNTKSFQKNNIASVGEAYAISTILGKTIRYTVPFIIAFLMEEIVFTLLGTIHPSIPQVFSAFLNGGFGPGSYYYPILIQFIFYFPVIYFIIRKYDFRGLFLCGFINFAYEILKCSYGMNEECYRLLLFRYTLLIAYGCYLALGTYKRYRLISVGCFVIGIAYIFCFKYMGLTPVITNYWTGTSMWACLYIIPLSSPLILNTAKNKFLETLGKASYDIFLVQMVYYNGAGIIYKYVGNRLLQIIINIIVCVSVGLVFHYVETPLTKRVNKVASKLLNRYETTLSKIS